MNTFLKFIYQIFLGLGAGVLTVAIIAVSVYPIAPSDLDAAAFIASLFHFAVIEYWFAKGLEQ